MAPARSRQSIQSPLSGILLWNLPGDGGCTQRAKAAFSVLSRALVIALALCPVAVCQQAGSDWRRVEALPAGQNLRVSVAGHNINCGFVSADAQTLHCDAMRTVLFFPTVHRYTFDRPEVARIKLSRQGLSEITGALIGAGAGAGAGVAADATASNHEYRSTLAIVFALLGGLVGEGIGHHTDFLATPTIYTAP